MQLRRILQLALTAFIGQGISILNQLLIPPLFLYSYRSGIEVYGEWLALSASVSYLGTLHYGIQTYSNNEMTILYNRGEVEEAKCVQASAFRLLLSMIGVLMALGVGVLWLPTASWLHLKHASNFSSSLTIYLLILQVAVSILFNLLTNSYMVVGRLPRGNYWAAAQRLCMILGMAGAVLVRASFLGLALVQLGSYLVFLLLVVVDVRRVAPILLPSLRYGTWRQVVKILKPSGHFGLIAIASVLTWQGPIILIQRLLGPVAVSIFSLSRVVFQMSRQILSVASSAVGQDITLLVGQRDWAVLRRLYDLSERVVLFLIPIVSIGSLLMCPYLFTVWLHRRSVYEPALCILMAISSAVMGIKEHKTQFQSSSNEHETFSIIAVTGYTLMLITAIFTVKAFGLIGFMGTWVTWETIQTILVLRLNRGLFPAEMDISMRPLKRLAVFMVIAFGLAIWPAYQNVHWPLSQVVAVSVLSVLVLGTAAYFAFGIGELRELLTARIRRRMESRA